MALIMAIGIMTVLGTAGATSMYYATAGARTSNYSNTKTGTFSLAESGIASIMSVLNNPTTNALDPDALCPTGQHTPCSQTTTYTNGTVTWSGVLNRSTAVWDVTSIGSSRNSSASPSKVSQKLTAKVTVTPTNTQPLNNPSWNYMFATRTGNTCDETLNNNVGGGSRMYVAGNLCLSNNANLAPSALVVLGNLDVDNNASVGSSSSMSTRTETYVGGWCHYGRGTDGQSMHRQSGRQQHLLEEEPAELHRRREQQPDAPGRRRPPTSPAGTRTRSPDPRSPALLRRARLRSSTRTTRRGTTASRPRSISLRPRPTPAASARPAAPAASSPGTPRRTCSRSPERSSSTAAPRSPTRLASYNGQAALYLSGTFLVTGKLCGGDLRRRTVTSPAGTRTPRCSRS